MERSKNIELYHSLNPNPPKNINGSSPARSIRLSALGLFGEQQVHCDWLHWGPQGVRDFHWIGHMYIICLYIYIHITYIYTYFRYIKIHTYNIYIYCFNYTMYISIYEMGYLYWNMNGPITGIVPLWFLWEYVMIEFIGTGFFQHQWVDHLMFCFLRSPCWLVTLW